MVSCSKDPAVVRQQAIRRGQQHFAEGRFSEAALLYRKALQSDITSGEVWYLLGLCEERMGNQSSAHLAFQQALVYDPNHEPSLARLANSEIGQLIASPDRAQELSASIERKLKVLLKNPDSFEGNRLSGLFAMAKADPNKAIQFLELALKKVPFEPGATTTLVQNLFLAGQAPHAMDLALQLIEKNPKFGPIYDVVYSRHLDVQQFADAEAVLLRKASSLPKSLEAQLQVCRHYLKFRKPTQLENFERKLSEQTSLFPDARIKLAEIHSEFNDVDGALRLLQEGATLNPAEGDLYKKKIATALMAAGRNAEARKIVEDVLSRNPNDSDARGALAVFWVQGNQPKEIDQAIAELERLLSIDSTLVTYRYNLALAYESKRDWKQVRRHLKQILAQDPKNLLATRLMANASLRERDFADVLRYTRAWLDLEPNDSSAQTIQAIALAGQGYLPEAESQLRAIAAKHPGDREARIQLGLTLFLQKRYSESESLLEKEYKSAPEDSRLLNALFQLWIAQGKSLQASSLLEQRVASEPNASQLRLMAAQAAAQAGRFDLALAHYKKVIEFLPQDPIGYIASGQIHLSEKRLDLAIDFLKKGVALDSGNAMAFAALGDAFSQSGQIADSLAAYRRSIEIDPRQPNVLNNMADRLIEQNGNLEEALRYIKTALADSPGQHEFQDTLGMVYLKMNHIPQATAIFLPLTQKYPASAPYRYHYGLSLLNSGEKSKAILELKAALALQPSKEIRTKIESLVANTQQALGGSTGSTK